MASQVTNRADQENKIYVDNQKNKLLVSLFMWVVVLPASYHHSQQENTDLFYFKIACGAAALQIFTIVTSIWLYSPRR